MRGIGRARRVALLASGTLLIATAYGLVRFAYGLFLPDVQAELGIDTTVAGLISSGSSLVYCIAALASFFLAARHPRALVVAAAVGAAGGAAGMAASTDAQMFAVFAVLSSSGAGFVSPALVSIVARNVPRDASDRSQAIVNAGTGPGLVGAGILALMLLPDWRLAWFIVAGLAVTVAVAVLLLDARGADASPARFPPLSWFRAHVPLIAATLLLGAGSAAVWNFGRTHLVESGVSEPASIATWIAIGVGGAGVILTARAMSALPPRAAWALTTIVVAVASVVSGLLPHVTAALGAGFAFGWGYVAATGALIAWTTRMDRARAPAGTSLLFVVLVLGQACGATATGALIDAVSPVSAFIAAAIVTAAAALVAQLSREKVD